MRGILKIATFRRETLTLRIASGRIFPVMPTSPKHHPTLEERAKKVFVWIAIAAGIGLAFMLAVVVFSVAPGTFPYVAFFAFCVGGGYYGVRCKLGGMSTAMGVIRCNHEGYPAVSHNKARGYIYACSRCGSEAWEAIQQEAAQ